jgi:alkyldihydroxyacetonephosphate synthase
MGDETLLMPSSDPAAVTTLPEPMKWWGWGDESIEFDISKHPLLWDYLAPIFRLKSCERTVAPVALENISLPAQKAAPDLARELAAQWGAERISDSRRARITHAFGKSLRDLWRLRNGIVPYAPDYVVYPASHDQVRFLVDLAASHRVILIPFGGGSNIAGCLEPARETERTVVSVDLRLMNRLLELDRESGIARFEAGVMGPDLETGLNREGLTLGHFPDSFLFSTLGGWVATRSAGMQSDRYGKIEDMVLSVRMASPAGTIETRAVPKASNGIDVNHLCIGSEGTLGIITEIAVRVHRRPSRRATYGYLFPDFYSGVQAIRECHRLECVPAMSRLNDAARTALSFAYRARSSFVQHHAGQAMKFYIRKIRRMDFATASLMLATFEGEPETFGTRRERSESIYRKFGAVPLGESPGRGFQKGKYDFPYLRDFLLDRGVLADVSETSTTWRNLLPLHQKSLCAIQQAIDAEGTPGTVGCHVSHSYDSGASLYFTFGFAATREQEMQQYLRIKKAAQDSFLDNGATLSHHHAVGYEHLPWLEREISAAGVAAIESLKSGLDPAGVMNPGKLSRGFGFEEWLRK